MITNAPRSVLRRFLVVATLAAACVIPATAVATTILPMDLDALTSAAGRVFRGRVTAVRSGRDGRGLPATWTTFAIDEALKGAPGSALEIKQLGVDAALPDGTVFRVPALPRYRVGDELILFLHPESREGFTSPVGFGQGRFRIRHENGRALAENDVGNANLTGARSQARTGASPPDIAAPIPVDEILARVRAATRAAR